MESHKDKHSRFVIDIPVEIHKKLKLLSVIHDKSMKELVIQSMIDVINKLELINNGN